MLRTRHPLTIAPILLLLAAPAVAGGLNLLPNGDFNDLDNMDIVVDWYELFPTVSEMNNGVDDADDCTYSGMGNGINTNTDADFGGAVWSTCTNDIVVGETYRVRGAIKFPFQTGDARGSVDFIFTTNLDCFGSSLGGGFMNGFILSNELDWVRFETTSATAPEGAKALRVDILLTKIDKLDPVADIHFDRIEVMPTSYLFSEDFEDGSTCRWSGEVGVQ